MFGVCHDSSLYPFVLFFNDAVVLPQVYVYIAFNIFYMSTLFTVIGELSIHQMPLSLRCSSSDPFELYQ